MAKTFRHVTFVGATQASRLHPSEVDVPQVSKLENLYISRSDRVPTLRGDLVRFRDDTYSLAGRWTHNTAVSEYLNTLITGPIAQSQIFLSTFCPSAISGGYGQPTCNTLIDGTVGTSGTKVTKVGTTAVGTLAGCSSEQTQVLTNDSTWGFEPLVGDLVQITSATTTEDAGWYVLVDFTQDKSMDLNRLLAGADSDVAVTITRSWLTTVWPRCFMSFVGSSRLYRVRYALDDLVLYLDDGDYPDPAVSRVAYTLMEVHDGNRANAPFATARFNDIMLYQAVNPLGGNTTEICGPFYAQGDWSGDELTDYIGSLVKTITSNEPGLLGHSNVLGEAGLLASLSYSSPSSSLTYDSRVYSLGVFLGMMNGVAYKPDGPIRYVVVGANGAIITTDTLTKLASYATPSSVAFLKLSATGTAPKTVTVDRETHILTVSINGSPQSWTLTDAANSTMGAMRRHLDGLSLGGGTVSATLPTSTGTHDRLHLECSDGTTPTVGILDGSLTITVNGTPDVTDLTASTDDTYRKLVRNLDGKSIGDGTIQASMAATAVPGQLFTLAMTGGVTPTAEMTSAGVLSVYSDTLSAFPIFTVSAVGTTPTVEVAGGNLTLTIDSIPQVVSLPSYTVRQLVNGLNGLHLGNGVVTCGMYGTPTSELFAATFVAYGSGNVDVSIDNGFFTASSGGSTVTLTLASYATILLFSEHGVHNLAVGSAVLKILTLGSDYVCSQSPTLLDEFSATIVSQYGSVNVNITTWPNDGLSASDIDTLAPTSISAPVDMTATAAADTVTWTLASYPSSTALVAAINASPYVGPGMLTAVVGAQAGQALSSYDAETVRTLSATPISFTGTITADDNLPSENLDTCSAVNISSGAVFTEHSFGETSYVSALLDPVTGIDISSEKTLYSTSEESIWISATGTTPTLDIGDRSLTVTINSVTNTVDLLGYTIATLVTYLDGLAVGDGTVSAVADVRGYTASRPAGALAEQTALDISTVQQIFVSAVTAFTLQTSGVSTTLRDVLYDAGQAKFVAVGDDGVVLHSTDGQTWIPASSVPDVVTDLYVLGFAMKWYAFGKLGKNFWTWNSTDGDTWTSAHLLVNEITSIASSNSALVAIGPGTVLFSTTGDDWTAETPVSEEWYNSIDWLDTWGGYVAVGEGGAIASSADGETWATETSGTSVALNGVSLGVNSTSIVQTLSISATGGTPTLDVAAGTLTITIDSVADPTDLTSYTLSTLAAYLNGRSVGSGVITATAEVPTWVTPNDAVDLVDVSGLDISTTQIIDSGSDPHANTLMALAVGEQSGGEPVMLASVTPGTWDAVHCGLSGVTLYGLCGHGWEFVAVGSGGTIIRSLQTHQLDTAAGWEQMTSGTTHALRALCRLGGLEFACGDSGTILRNTSGTWEAVTSTVTTDLLCCASDEASTVSVAGKGGVCVISDDGGDTFTSIVTGTTKDIISITYSGPGTAFFACTSTEIIRIARKGYGSVLVWKPLSPVYRSVAFACVDGYVVLFNTSEWNSDTKKYEHFYRRIRWSAPVLYKDFCGQGSGYADVPGFGAFLDARTLGHTVIVAEEKAISALTPSGDPDNPWDYRVIRQDFWATSNLCVIDDSVYFIGPDGTLYAANATQVAAVPCQLDVSIYSDAASDTPTQLAWDHDRQLLAVFHPTGSGAQTVFTVNLETMSVSSYVFPDVFSEVGAATPLRGIVQQVNAFPPVPKNPVRTTL